MHQIGATLLYTFQQMTPISEFMHVSSTSAIKYLK